MNKFAPALVSLLLVLSACGGGDSSDDSAETAPAAESGAGTTSDSPEPEPTEPDPADEAIAEAALLSLQDFPAGWEAAQADDSDDDSGPDKDAIAECMGVEYGDLYNEASAQAESRTFKSPNDLEVDNSVGVARDEEWMTNAFEHTASQDFRDCTAAGLQEYMEEASEEEGSSGGRGTPSPEMEIGEVSVNEMNFGSYGDASSAFRVTVPVSAQGLNFELSYDFVYVRVGRGQTLVIAGGLGGSFSAEEMAEYVEIAVNRLDQELAAT